MMVLVTGGNESRVEIGEGRLCELLHRGRPLSKYTVLREACFLMIFKKRERRNGVQGRVSHKIPYTSYILQAIVARAQQWRRNKLGA